MTEVNRPCGTLRQIFPEGDVFAVTDDGALGAEAAELGLKYVPLDEAAGLPDGARVVLLLQHHMISKPMRMFFRRQAVLVVPMASFDGAPDAAAYTLRMTLLTDYLRAASTAAYWIDKLRENAEKVVFGPPRADDADPDATRLVCSLGSALRVDAWPNASIGTGQWVSIGSCCELSITKQPSDVGGDVFSMDGVALASGVLAACDPRVTAAGERRVLEARRLRAEMAALGTIRLSMKDNVLTSVTAGGEDFTERLREVTNPDHGLQALELGIGTNLAVLPEVDWRFNSQLNEGAGVMHIGFGEGITGAHMDFVIPESDHHFLY
ncbi:hypothetical protein ACFXKC_42345 [Streptomyces sp. NPDC059340]|uniref:hypothetical protein n=1 Tax=Streptomyces sp. NPDC059340 TaxID=3346806 RepID=UPI00368C8467